MTSQASSVAVLLHPKHKAVLFNSGKRRGLYAGEILDSQGYPGGIVGYPESNRLYFESIRQNASQLNGRFLLLEGGECQNEQVLITDRLGSLHGYYVLRDDRVVAIGTELADLARHHSSRELDWEAIATFFTLGFFLDDRTYFKDIRIFEPASIYRISADGEIIEHRRYWEWHHHVDRTRSYSDTIDEYHALLRQAVERCTNTTGKPILPLSGGLDSRSLAVMMPEGAETQTYSYGYTRDSIEIHIAGQVAAARKFAFTSHVIQPYLFDRLEEIVKILHGSQDVTQARQMSINAWVRERADGLLTGLWGDVWCDQMGAADGLPEGTSAARLVQAKMQKRGYAWLIEHIVRPNLPDVDPFELVAERIATGMHQFDHIEDVDFRIKAYKTSRWAFRWSNASLRGFEPGAEPRVPYYDVDLVDFFCTVPTEFIRERRLQIDHLKRYAPDLARVEWQPAWANLYLAKYGYWLSLPRRAWNKARRTLRGERPIQRNWEVQFLSDSGRAGLQKWLLEPGLKLHEYVPRSEIAALLSEFYSSPTACNGYTVSMLLTFSAWLECILK